MTQSRAGGPSKNNNSMDSSSSARKHKMSILPWIFVLMCGILNLAIANLLLRKKKLEPKVLQDIRKIEFLEHGKDDSSAAVAAVPNPVDDGFDINENYKVIFPNPASPPHNEFTPHVNLVWSRGWYNAVDLPKKVSLGYYNQRGRSDNPSTIDELQENFDPEDVCKVDYVWVRGRDVGWFAKTILPSMNCSINLITGDCPDDVPQLIYGGNTILQSRKIKKWYAQDVAKAHKKLVPIPLGVPIHYGFDGSPNSLHTVEYMAYMRKDAPPLESRQRSIFVDIGQLGGSGRRDMERSEATDILSRCHNVRMWTRGHAVDFWKELSSHQFGVAVTGTGWDTFRMWELLFFGTIPIVKSSPLDMLIKPSHLPVIIVKDWSEICDWKPETYLAYLERYKGWVKNAHHWLKPSLWIPRNQELMDKLCDLSPGCRDK